MLSGLAGTVFAALVLINARGATIAGTQRDLLLVAAVLLALAFILAPFVRRAFVPPTATVARPTVHKTLLDEMRDGEAQAESGAEAEQPRQPSRVAFRLLVGLYLVFGLVLIVVLGKL